jgi:hypothetical protein
MYDLSCGAIELSSTLLCLAFLNRGHFLLRISQIGCNHEAEKAGAIQASEDGDWLIIHCVLASTRSSSLPIPKHDVLHDAAPFLGRKIT